MALIQWSRRARPAFFSASPLLMAGIGLTVTPAGTPTWASAAAHDATLAGTSGSYEPILLASFPDFVRTFGTALVTGIGVERELAQLSAGGMGAITLTLNELDDTARLGGASVALLNEEDLVETLSERPMQNTSVILRLGFQGLPYADFLTLFTGVVDRYTITNELLNLALVDVSVMQSTSLSHPIDAQYFPGATQDSRTKNIPIFVGGVVDAPALQIAGDATGTLAIALGTADTTLRLVEVDALFPASGTLTIGAETGVTYTGRSFVNVEGVTYLELSGLTRPSPVTHAVLTLVTLTNVSYVYLLGYEIPSPSLLNVVRENGVVVNPANYVYSVMQADRPVSVITFTSQRETITVDVGADASNRLTNGGFETGSASGWTTANGGSVVVGTTAPTAYERTYRAALTGGLNSNGDLRQDITSLTVGDLYEYRFAYQNQQANPLMTNGGFEDGLTGWTQQNDTGLTLIAAAFGDGADEGIVYTRAFLPFLPFTSIPALAAIELYRDVTTVASTSYTLSFATRTRTDYTVLSQLNFSTRVSVRIGTPADDDAYQPTLYASTTHRSIFGTIISGPRGGPPDQTPLFARLDATSFVAATTTTRITFRFETTVYPSAQLVIIELLRAELDNVVLRSTIDDHSAATVLFGTPTTPGEYFSQALPVVYAWTRVSGLFTAESASARATLQSQYALTSFPTYYDDVQIRPALTGIGTMNPVDAMLYLLDTFLPSFHYNRAAFIAARTALVGWKFGTYLTAPGDGAALLQHMARQCKSLFYLDALGEYTILVLDHSREVVFTFNTTNIVEGSFSRASAPADALHSSIYVYFAAKTGGSSSPGDFAGVTFATPDDSTHPTLGGTLSAQCAAAQDLYGREHRLDFFADWIQDFGTANLLLEWLVSRHTSHGDLFTFATWLDALPVHLGELVEVTHPKMPRNGAPMVCEVVEWGFEPAQMQARFTVRAVRFAPVDAPIANADTVLVPLPRPPVTVTVTDNDVPDPRAALDLASVDLNPGTAGQQTSRTIAGQGTFVVNAAGEVTLIPLPTFTGTSITYTVADIFGTISNAATITAQLAIPGAVRQGAGGDHHATGTAQAVRQHAGGDHHATSDATARLGMAKDTKATVP